ncbi:hypothetical protein, partial [Shewanella sp.]|uniref:hypothetical protein n=1 Tax=Shewanella sp. TaxID=50422 RepID=UPI00260A7404
PLNEQTWQICRFFHKTLQAKEKHRFDKRQVEKNIDIPTYYQCVIGFVANFNAFTGRMQPNLKYRD